MTYEFKYLMEVLSYAAVGGTVYAPNQTINWKSLLKLADKQNVLPMLTYAINKLDNTVVPENIKQLFHQQGRSLVINAQLKKLNVLALLSKLEAKGIEGVILKGFSLSHCYYLPDIRISGDTDIYIKHNDERAVLNLMSTLGFHISRRQAISNHSECYSDPTGWVEIHTELYHKRAQEIWFGNLEAEIQKKEKYTTIDDNDGAYRTLGYTDNIIFLSLHLIKHFIPEGINLRQVLDVSLFYFKHYDKIDICRYWELLRKLHYDTLISTVLSISIKNFALPVEWASRIRVQSSAEMEQILIKDMEGDCSPNNYEMEGRSKSGIIYTRIIGSNQIGKTEYILYMINRNMHIWARHIFPRVSNLKRRYPILMTHNALIPIIWFYHVFIHAPICLLTNKLSLNRTKEEVTCSSRLEMFKKLGMLQ